MHAVTRGQHMLRSMLHTSSVSTCTGDCCKSHNGCGQRDTIGLQPGWPVVFRQCMFMVQCMACLASSGVLVA